MDTDRIRRAAEDLERHVALAKAAGFENADCVLTPEVVALLPLAKAGKLKDPVELEFTAGPAHNFCETSLGDCKDLENAWSEFRSAVEGWDEK